MRDFRAFVARHLPALEMADRRRDKIVDELALELEARYTVRLEQGASEEEAWQEVVAQVPSWPSLARELSGPRHVVARRRGWELLQDIRIGCRVLWKHRGFTATSVTTLALCLALNTVILTGVNAMLFHALPVPEPDRILLMANQYPLLDGRRPGTVSATPDYFDRLQYVTALEEQAMYTYGSETFEIQNAAVRVVGMIATPSLFRILRETPAQGRLFTEDEARPGNDRRILLSDGLWNDRYGRDPAVIGRVVHLSGRDFTIVGVMPPQFSFGGPLVRFWMPLAFTDRQRSDGARHGNGWTSIGRLKPGATIEQVRQQLTQIDAANAVRLPQLKTVLASTGFYTSVEPLQDVLVRDVRRPLYVLAGGALVVLLIGIVNLANLALARSRTRLRELGTRTAIGGHRLTIARQLFVEGALVGLAGGAIGLGLGAAALPVLKLGGLLAFQDPASIRIDLLVIVPIFILATAIGILMGAVSAMPLFTMSLGAMLRDDARTGTGGRKARSVRRTLVVVQMACSFTVLAGAGLLWMTFQNLQAVNPGYRIADIVTAAITLPNTRYANGDDVRAFTARSLEAIRAIPGVTAAASTTIIPLSLRFTAGPIVPEGRVARPGEPMSSGVGQSVTPGYFATLGIPVAEGRDFDESDTRPTTQSIILDERLATRFWPGQSPIGKRLYRPTNQREMLGPDADTRWLTVVGVVRSVRLRELASDDEFAGTYYMPYAAGAARDYGYVIHTSGDPAARIREIRAAVARIDPQLPLSDVLTMAERASASIQSRRSAMQLAGAFAVAALFLSSVGLYGLLAYLVAQRSREIGVRIAIGSTPRAITFLVLREALVLAGAGVAAGLLVSSALRRVLTAQLYGIDASDPGVLLLVTLTLGAVALIACTAPARRAAGVDVTEVLKSQ